MFKNKKIILLIGVVAVIAVIVPLNIMNNDVLEDTETLEWPDYIPVEERKYYELHGPAGGGEIYVVRLDKPIPDMIPVIANHTNFKKAKGIPSTISTYFVYVDESIPPDYYFDGSYSTETGMNYTLGYRITFGEYSELIVDPLSP